MVFHSGLFRADFFHRVHADDVFLFVAQLTCRKIDKVLGIDCFAQVAYFEVQVASGGASCVTSQTDDVTCRHFLVLVHQRTAQMAVNGLQTVVMTHHYEIAVASRVPAYDTHLSAPCRTDGIAYLHFDVGAFVHPVTAPAELTGHVTRSRQTEARHRNVNIPFQAVEHRPVGIDALVRPDETVYAVGGVVVHQRSVA